MSEPAELKFYIGRVNMTVLRCTNHMGAPLTYDVEPFNPNGTYYRAAHDDEIVVKNPDHVKHLLSTNDFIVVEQPTTTPQRFTVRHNLAPTPKEARRLTEELQGYWRQHHPPPSPPRQPKQESKSQNSLAKTIIIDIEAVPANGARVEPKIPSADTVDLLLPIATAKNEEELQRAHDNAILLIEAHHDDAAT